MLALFAKLLNPAIISMPYYAVRVGRNPGVYHTWDLCKAEVVQFPKARYKKFATEEDARSFVKGFDHPGQAAPNSYDGATSSGRQIEAPGTSVIRKFPTWSPSKNTACSKVNTSLVDKEIEVLKERLELLERQKSLAAKEQELEEMRKMSGSSPAHPGRSTDSMVARGSRTPGSHSVNKPYSRNFSTTHNKPSRKTKLLEMEEVRKLYKETTAGDDSGGVTVYTDGACVNNGRHSAKAGIGVYWGPDHPYNVSERLEGRPTNNRAEIHAVVKAVEQAKEMGISDLNVHTDSQFLINAMTKWVFGWMRNGWKLSSGGDVINREDFETLQKACRGIRVTYTHVRGHQGIAGNEAADRLAVQGAAQSH